MSAGNQKQEIRESEVRIGEARRKRVAFEMIDGDQRLPGSERQPLSRKKRDHHSADQPGPGGRGDRIDVVDRHLGVTQNPLDQAWQDLDVGACGDLRNDAAIGLVSAVLAHHGLGEDLPVTGDQRHGAVVAGGLRGQGLQVKQQSFRVRPFA